MAGNGDNAITWVFFDVGDVLFDEDPQHLYYFHSMLQALRRNGINAIWDEFRAQIFEAVRRDPTHFMQNVMRSYLPDVTTYDRVFHEGREAYEAIRKPRMYGVLANDVQTVLESLKAEGYRCGVIANQHPPIIQAFEEYGLSALLDVVIIDEVVGVSKPNPAIFHLALEKAGCEPGQAVMVGDRPDVDIGPARRVGMKAVRLERGILYTWCDPADNDECADLVIRDIRGLPDALKRLS